MRHLTRKDFLEALFSDYFKFREGFIMVKIVKNYDHKTSIRYFPNVEILSREEYPADSQVFFGVCPRESMKPDKSHVKYMAAIWAGLDLGPDGYSGKNVYFFGQPQAAKAVRSFPLPPSIIVESGWGLHLYWLLNEATPVEDVEAMEGLLAKINSYFQCKSNVGMDSMLRLPDTLNGKVGSHVVDCRVKYINRDFRYDLSDFQNLSLVPGAAAPETPNLSMNSQSREIAATAAAEVVSTIEDIADEDMEPLDESGEHVEVNEEDIEEEDSEPEFEPVPYEFIDAADDPDLPFDHDELADAVAQRVIKELNEKMMGEWMDAIVERLLKRLDISPKG